MPETNVSLGQPGPWLRETLGSWDENTNDVAWFALISYPDLTRVCTSPTDRGKTGYKIRFTQRSIPEFGNYLRTRLVSSYPHSPSPMCNHWKRFTGTACVQKSSISFAFPRKAKGLGDFWGRLFTFTNVMWKSYTILIIWHFLWLRHAARF